MQHRRVLFVRFDGHELVFEPGQLGAHEIDLALSGAPLLSEFLMAGDLILVVVVQPLQLFPGRLQLARDVRDFFLNSEDLLVYVLEGDQVAEIGIHLEPPSFLTREGESHFRCVRQQQIIALALQYLTNPPSRSETANISNEHGAVNVSRTRHVRRRSSATEAMGPAGRAGREYLASDGSIC
jgi:hypothetical protein